MRAVVQRVSEASVSVESKTVGKIGQGLLVFLGIEEGDSDADLQYVTSKILGLRIFDDENGVPNRSVCDIAGSVLLISQFTLCGDARHGKRPSYIKAARPEQAIPLYEAAIRMLSQLVPVETGVFQAIMSVALVNDGPFTILLDSRRTF